MNKVYITSCYECESHIVTCKLGTSIGCIEESNTAKPIETKEGLIPDWCPKLHVKMV